MNSKHLKIPNLKNEKDLFLSINQQPFTELLTFIDFVDNKLNIGLVEIKFSQDRDILINALIEHPECNNIQFEILDFSSPNLRFLRDELVTALQQIQIEPNKKLILLITGLEKSIGIVEEHPAVLTNLNFVRDDLRTSIPHPILLFLPDYALTRLAKYAPDFWAWNRKVFSFKTNRANLIANSNSLVYVDDFVENLELPAKRSRIELLLHLLDEYNSSSEEEKKNNLSTISDIYNELGRAYYSLGGYDKAINYYQQSLAISQEIGDRNGEGKSLNNLGNAYHSLREYQRAIDYHQQSLAIAQPIGDRHGEGSSLGNLGVAYYSLGEYQRAIDYHQQSLEIATEIGDRYGEAASLNNLGNAYHSLGEYRRAIDFYQQSLVIKQQIGDRNGEGNSLIGLGNAYHSLGEYQRAIEFYQQSLAITRQIGDRNGEANSLNNLGIIYRYLGEYQTAINYLQKSLEIFREIGDRNGEANSLSSLGIIYRYLGEYQRAIEFYQQSLKIFREIGDRHGEANAWFNLAETRQNLQQKLKAKTAYENARNLYQAMELDKKVEDCNEAIQSLEE